MSHLWLLTSVVYLSFIMLMSWHQHFLGSQKKFKGFSCYLHLPLAKHFNLRMHQCSISMVFSLFVAVVLLVAMLQWYCYCVIQLVGYPNISAELLKIKLWCLNSNTKHKGEIQCPPPHLTICSKCARRPSFGPCFRKFSPRVRGARGCPQCFPMTSALPKTMIHHWLTYTTHTKRRTNIDICT